MEEENKLIEERREKLKALRGAGAAFPNDFRRRDMASDVIAKFAGKTKEELEKAPVGAGVAGRMMLKRVMGKASFATLQDGSGRIQAYITQDVPGYEAFKHWDLGDLVGVEGHLFKTMKGELTVHATSVRLLAKALRPLPEKFHGLSDHEMRYRQRYVDLIVNPEVRELFLKRSRIIEAVREVLRGEGYLEVETPMMQPIPGGAAARPFRTHHNALDMELYLRIAPELYLKRLVVGGIERVFEINRNFRNEGISTRHNPEFTMLEWYSAYEDWTYMMDSTERLVRAAAGAALGGTSVTYQGRQIDLGKPFARLPIPEAIRRQGIEGDAAPGELPGEERAIAQVAFAALAADRLRDGQARERLAQVDLTALASCKSRSLRRPRSIGCHHRHSCMPTRPKSHRSPDATIPIRSSPTASNSSSAAARSPTAFRS